MRKSISAREPQTVDPRSAMFLFSVPAKAPAPPSSETSPLPRPELLPAPFPRGRGKRPIGEADRETVAKLAHDARNLLSAVSLYCELLAGPGVLAPPFRHYADDLRLVGETGARLVAALAGVGPGSGAPLPLARRSLPGIEDLASELETLEAPLRALAGPAMRFEVECAPCAGSLALNPEELLRILFNLVANSVEAMLTAPASARRHAFLRITAQLGQGASFLSGRDADATGTVVLSVRDNGPGIPTRDLDRIFDPGFSTRRRHDSDRSPHGLGLAIVRQLVESAGGEVRVVSSPSLGTRFDMEFPLLAAQPADHSTKNSDFFSPIQEKGIRC